MLEFHVSDMTCGGCVRAITNAVQQLDARAQVTTDIPAHQVRVETSAARDAVLAAITAAGFTAK